MAYLSQSVSKDARSKIKTTREMRDSHSSGGSDPRSENEIIQIGSMLVCISAVVVAFFSRAIAWGILLLPIAHLLVTAFATGSAKLRDIPELSGNANIMLRRWHSYYLPGCGHAFWRRNRRERVQIVIELSRTALQWPTCRRASERMRT
jgi:hypothetical protein